MGIAAAGATVAFANIYALQKFNKAGLVKAALVTTDRLGVGLLCLEPGQGQDSHTHDGSDKLYFVVEGVATVTVGAETRELGPGTCAVATGGEPHGLWNKGRDRLTVVSVVAPPPHAPGKA